MTEETSEEFPEQSEESDHEFNERISKPEDFVTSEEDGEDDGSQ